MYINVRQFKTSNPVKQVCTHFCEAHPSMTMSPDQMINQLSSVQIVNEKVSIDNVGKGG